MVAKPIISLDDASFWVGSVSEKALNRASARVRAFVRQRISFAEHESAFVGASPFLLPQRPVCEILSVRTRDDAAVTEWKLWGQKLFTHVDDVRVKWSAGFENIPDEIAELVATVAYRIDGVMATPGLAIGASQEAAGSENVSYGAHAYAGVSGLTEGEKKILLNFFPQSIRTVDVFS